jgi:hypothetical protein
VPWKQHLYALEGELGIKPEESVLFVLYEDDRENKWRIQAVSVGPGRCGRVTAGGGGGGGAAGPGVGLRRPPRLGAASSSGCSSLNSLPALCPPPDPAPAPRPQPPNSFENRKSIGTPAWRGLRDAELSKVAGVPGCVFVHASGFIGGNDTYEGALQMARLSLAAPAE